MAVGQGIVLQHDRDRRSGAFAGEFRAKRSLGHATLDEIIGHLQVAFDLKSELAEFLHQKLGTLELLLPQFLVIEDFL